MNTTRAEEPPMAAQPEPQLICRRSRGRLVFGVASGLADYLMVDPLLMRLSFVGLALLGGAGLVLYLALAIILPSERSVDGDSEARLGLRAARAFQLTALALIAGGTLLLGRMFGWGSWLDWGQVGPLALIAIGLSIILREDQTSREDSDEID